jgi:hypothetical protein
LADFDVDNEYVYKLYVGDWIFVSMMQIVSLLYIYTLICTYMSTTTYIIFDIIYALPGILYFMTSLIVYGMAYSEMNRAKQYIDNTNFSNTALNDTYIDTLTDYSETMHQNDKYAWFFVVMFWPLSILIVFITTILSIIFMILFAICYTTLKSKPVPKTDGDYTEQLNIGLPPDMESDTINETGV